MYNKAVYSFDSFINEIPETITKEMFNECKYNAKDCRYEQWIIGLVEFFSSYSARGFVGGWALGGERDFYHERLRNFQKQIPNLKGIIFKVCDVMNLESNESLIYLDPPYKGTTKYDFGKDFNYEQFWNKVRELSKNNIVIISEQEAPNDFEIIWEKEVKRNVFNAKSIKASEKLFRIK